MDIKCSSLSYGKHEMHTYDLYYRQQMGPGSTRQPLVCYIHGGAWRAEDKSDFKKYSIDLCTRSQFVVAVLNYRLTPRDTAPPGSQPLHHPAHSEDLLLGLEYLRDQPTHNLPYDPTRIYLIGHSCSAHMISSIILDNSKHFPSLTPTPALLSSIQAVVLSEGIYDINLLLQSFPSYRAWFIANTFRNLPNYDKFCTSELSFRPNGKHVRWLIIHSEKDTLVDMPQSIEFAEHIRAELREDGVSRAKANPMVTLDTETCQLEHSENLHCERYMQLVSRFVVHDAWEAGTRSSY